MKENRFRPLGGQLLVQPLVNVLNKQVSVVPYIFQRELFKKNLQLRIFEDRHLVSDKTVLCRSVPFKNWIGKKSLNPWLVKRLPRFILGVKLR